MSIYVHIMIELTYDGPVVVKIFKIIPDILLLLGQINFNDETCLRVESEQQ